MSPATGNVVMEFIMISQISAEFDPRQSGFPRITIWSKDIPALGISSSFAYSAYKSNLKQASTSCPFAQEGPEYLLASHIEESLRKQSTCSMQILYVWHQSWIQIWDQACVILPRSPRVHHAASTGQHWLSCKDYIADQCALSTSSGSRKLGRVELNY